MDDKKEQSKPKKAVDLEKKREQERRNKFDTLLKRKFFVVPSFEIYGGVGGLYDFGPPGCALMNNLIQLWRQHFVLTEDMLEIYGPSMTPEIVLKASGHVEKFADYMVRDTETDDCFRADKILEERLDLLLENTKLTTDQREELKTARSMAGAYKKDELTEALRKYEVTAPDTGNPISEPYEFNLMFKTSIGPTSRFPGYLRPETAQGIFVNFRRLLEYNGGRMPFAAAQIGTAFRNEIAPRAGLLRVREFTLAEIEHFVNPDDKRHPKFKGIARQHLNLFSQALQAQNLEAQPMELGEAVARGIINNETLAYFMGRTHLFLVQVGIKEDKLRFRQHKKNEMAHYAQDCWDAEIFTTYGWVECVGIADRSAYDLKQHMVFSKEDLTARETYDVPREFEQVNVKLDNGKLGMTFGKNAQVIMNYFKSINKEDAIALKEKLKSGPQTIKVCDQEFVVEPSMVKDISLSVAKEHVHKYIPNVIEPSFGLGRILYSILEHAYDDTMYDDEQRAVLHLAPCIAATKAGIIPLMSNESLTPLLLQLSKDCVGLNVASKIDDSRLDDFVAIGRKYARADELGTPFCITVDFESLDDKCVTLRDRDTSRQVRIPIEDAALAVAQLVSGRLTWQHVEQKYPIFLRPDDSGESKVPHSQVPDFGDLAKPAGLKALNDYLATRSYLQGYTFTRHDAAVFSAVPQDFNPSTYKYLARWYQHVRSLPQLQQEQYKPSTEEKNVAAKPQKPNPEAQASQKKPQVAKSSVVLDVSPMDLETDMADLEARVRAITKEGLSWGGSQLIKVAFGIINLRIVCTVVDKLISVDDLQADIEALDGVQGTRIYAFNKA